MDLKRLGHGSLNVVVYVVMCVGLIWSLFSIKHLYVGLVIVMNKHQKDTLKDVGILDYVFKLC